MTPDIPTHSFTVGTATITVRQETGFDLAATRILWRKLVAERPAVVTDEVAAEFFWGDFAPAVLQTVSVEGDLGFPWVTVKGGGAEIAAAFDAFEKRPRLVGAFRVGIRAVEKLTPADEALLGKEATGAAVEPPSESPSTTGSPTAEVTPTNS